jgi:hypothetical protein
MQIGRRLYYDKFTGEILVDTGERSGNVIETTKEYDISVHNILSERDVNSYDVIELNYGEYKQDFLKSNVFRINPETKVVEFSYPNPENEIVYEKSLSSRLDEQEKLINAILGVDE